MRRLLTVSVLLGLWLVPQVARADWVSGLWTGRPVFAGGAFQGCIMETVFSPGGRRFRFMQLADFELLVGLGRRNAFPPGVHQFLMQIDGEVIRRAAGVRRPGYPNTLWINLGRDRFAREKLKKGYNLILHRTGGSAETRSLAGTYDALTRLEACVRNRN
jgi:hypothetical protein